VKISYDGAADPIEFQRTSVGREGPKWPNHSPKERVEHLHGNDLHHAVGNDCACEGEAAEETDPLIRGSMVLSLAVDHGPNRCRYRCEHQKAEGKHPIICVVAAPAATARKGRCDREMKNVVWSKKWRLWQIPENLIAGLSCPLLIEPADNP
jgi:hypothetical protein